MPKYIESKILKDRVVFTDEDGKTLEVTKGSLLAKELLEQIKAAKTRSRRKVT